MRVPRRLARLSRKPCAIHALHTPSISAPGGKFTVEDHHIHPLGMGGPDIPANMVTICPTGHTRVHELLSQWVKHGGQPPWSIRVWYGRAERELAERGYRAALPPPDPGQ